MAYKSLYEPINEQKYKGKANSSIVCRSTWERAVCKYFDHNPNVKFWNSEDVVIRYLCGTDAKYHRYYMDFYVEMTNGKRFIIEVKPHVQTQPPKEPKRKTKSYYDSQMTFVKNQSKWKAAREFAKKNGMNFAIWTEHSLKKLGIPIKT